MSDVEDRNNLIEQLLTETLDSLKNGSIHWVEPVAVHLHSNNGDNLSLKARIIVFRVQTGIELVASN